MTLLQQQRRLLQTLHTVPLPVAAPGSGSPWTGAVQAGLLAYQANAHALAERALSAAYPTLARLIGTHSLRALARAYWHAQPPRRGDLNLWGAGLADFIAADAQLADAPYLPDVARLEWALHRAAMAADVQPRPASFAHLADTDPNRLTALLAPGSALIASAYPAVALVLAHRPDLAGTVAGDPPVGDAQPDPHHMAQAAQALRAGQGQTAWLWRSHGAVRLRAALGAEPAALRALSRGASLGATLAAHPALNGPDWLALGIREAWLLGLRRHRGSPIQTGAEDA